MQLRRVLQAILILSALLFLCGAGRPREAKIQLGFGVDMARMGSWKEAEFRFRRAAELAPGDPVILNNLAVALENNGLYREANEAYLQALEFDPGNDRLRSNYERFHVFYEDLLERKAPDGDAGETASADPGDNP